MIIHNEDSFGKGGITFLYVGVPADEVYLPVRILFSKYFSFAETNPYMRRRATIASANFILLMKSVMSFSIQNFWNLDAKAGNILI